MKSFNNFVVLGMVIGMALILSGCGCTIIQPGHVGIKVNNLGSDRGVQNYEVQTGLAVYMPGMSTIFNYPVYVQTAVWTSNREEGNASNEEITFNTKEGTSVSGDISLSYQLQVDKVPSFYVKFRSDDLDIFTHGFLRNIARDAFNEEGSQYTLEEVYGAKKEELLTKIKGRINKEVNQYGVQLVQFGFVGKLRMDKQIEVALNNKLTTTQNAIAAENRLREATANAANQVARAKGEAESNLLLAKSITPELVKWRELEITEKAVARWNGARPMVEGTGSGMLLQLPIGK